MRNPWCLERGHQQAGTSLVELLFAALITLMVTGMLGALVATIRSTCARGADTLTATQCLVLVATRLRRDVARMDLDFDQAGASHAGADTWPFAGGSTRDGATEVTYELDPSTATLERREGSHTERLASGHVIGFEMAREADYAVAGQRRSGSLGSVPRGSRVVAVRIRVRLTVRATDESREPDRVRRLELVLSPVCANRRLASSWPRTEAQAAPRARAGSRGVLLQ